MVNNIFLTEMNAVSLAEEIEAGSSAIESDCTDVAGIGQWMSPILSQASRSQTELIIMKQEVE